jgi:hypothetical protein
MTGLLYHISDRPDIARFDPRPAPPQSAGQQGPEGEMVWAVDGDHLRNYLLPRDCPRVTYYATPTRAPEDVERLMAGTAARAVIAIETGWLPQVMRTTLYRYDFAPELILPVAVTPIPDLLTALLALRYSHMVRKARIGSWSSARANANNDDWNHRVESAVLWCITDVFQHRSPFCCRYCPFHTISLTYSA